MASKPGFCLQLLVAVIGLLGASCSDLCPKSCLCVNEVAVCDCKSSGDESVALGAFIELDYITKIYIHSCRKLIIEPYTFKGLSVIDEISIFDIDELVLRPHAFNLMKRYPEYFTIRNSYLDEIPTHAFSGMQHVKNFWFRDSRIRTIGTGIFRGDKNIENIYFWNMKIDEIQRNAFEDLSDVHMFALRSNILVHQIGESVFKNSVIRQITIKDAHITTWNPLAYTGMRGCSSLLISNVTHSRSVKNWKISSTGSQYQSLENVKVENSALDVFPIAAYSHVHSIEVYNCTLREVVPSLMPLRNVSNVMFTDSRIGTLKEHSFGNMERIRRIMFQKCDIKTIEFLAFGSNNIYDLQFRLSKIDLIQSAAFANSTIQILSFEKTSINVLNQKAFEKLTGTTIRLDNCQIDTLRTEVFKKISVKNFEIVRSKFRKIYGWAFMSSAVGNAVITNNKFDSPELNVFEGFGTESLTFSENLFGCVCDDFFFRLTNLEEKGTRFSPGAVVKNNMCYERGSSTDRNYTMAQFMIGCDPALTMIEPEKVVSENGQIVCQHMLLGSDCKCSNADTDLVLDENLANSMSFLRINILIIRDCRRVTILKRAFDGRKIFWLQLLNIRDLSIKPQALSGFSELEKLQISHSVLSSLDPESMNLPKDTNTVLFDNCKITDIKSDAFAGSNISTLIFDGCDIASIHSKAFAGFHVSNLSISESLIGSVQSSAIGEGAVGVLSISSSKVGGIAPDSIPSSLLEAGSFQNNGLMCHCATRFIPTLLNYQSVKIRSNLCIGPNRFAGKPLKYAARNLHLLHGDSASGQCPVLQSKQPMKPRKAELQHDDVPVQADRRQPLWNSSHRDRLPTLLSLHLVILFDCLLVH